MRDMLPFSRLPMQSAHAALYSTHIITGAWMQDAGVGYRLASGELAS